jgi:hypothetical protein
MSEPNPVNDLALADRAIENLIARYARHVDDGDFAGVGALFACGVFIGFEQEIIIIKVKEIL